MAIYGSLGDIDVGAISKSISDTAVDVFVYDTRKDSDGGAWRKRTQHTSWYNETLNTATRGSRRDFPAVAVIVATTNTIIIYDGDDPDMPMWMKFTDGYSTYLGMGIGGLTSVSMLNGVMVHGGPYDVHVTNFISDKTNRYGDNSGITVNHAQPISGRNDNTAGNYNGPTTPVIANRYINDVAMTVLPNAPSDPSTGLPVPTIAVATGGGTSIIRDDGTVVNITYTNFNVANSVHFTKDNKIAIFTDSATGGARFYRIYEIPNSNLDGGSYANMGVALRAYNGDAVAYNYPIRYFWYSNNIDIGNFYANALVYAKDGPVFGRNGRGIALIAEATNPVTGTINGNLSANDGMVCGISSSANTGWMHGDIKGAFLSDTSTASVTGTELNQYGDFASTTGWGSRSAAWTISGGVASVSSGAGYQLLGLTSGTLTNGRKYAVTVNVTAFTAGRLELSQANSSNIQFNLGSTGAKTLIFTYTGTTGQALGIYGYGDASYSFTIDNLYVRELSEADRSVNNTGLAVYGTITKSVVATGADLVGYSGFSGSNYFQQPQNTALDFGTGDFSIMFWGIMVPLTGTYRAFQINYVAGSTDLFMDGIGLAITVGGNNKLYQNQSSNNIGWSHQTIVRRSGVLYYYSNARLITSTSSTESLVTNSSSTLKIGEGFNQSLALFRISSTAPSPEQILKIYNDEKALFQTNSKSTLYGSSDAVTALAYDDTTKLLHVGTSSGRSDFQGLERINNTTTAVTTAISASNGLIAEQ